MPWMVSSTGLAIRSCPFHFDRCQTWCELWHFNVNGKGCHPPGQGRLPEAQVPATPASGVFCNKQCVIKQLDYGRNIPQDSPDQADTRASNFEEGQ